MLQTLQANSHGGADATLSGPGTTIEEHQRPGHFGQSGAHAFAIPEDERESELGNTQLQFAGAHPSTGVTQLNGSPPGKKSNSRATLTNPSGLEELGTKPRLDSTEYLKQQNRMKVNINNQEYEDYEANSNAYDPNGQFLQQMPGATQVNIAHQAQKSKQTLKQSRQLNARKPLGNSSIRTLIKSAATRE